MSNLEDESLRKLGIGTILNFLRKKYVGEKKLFIPLLIARIALAVLGMLPALYYKQIVDLIANFTGGEKTLILSQGISLLLIVVYLKVITNAFNRIADFFVIQQYLILSRKIYLEAFEYVHRHSYRFFSNNFTGSLIKKINKLV
jgi:ABC-type multidrug transport system fused ATPase/permease subunit